VILNVSKADEIIRMITLATQIQWVAHQNESEISTQESGGLS
jgi:hypothetical protein